MKSKIICISCVLTGIIVFLFFSTIIYAHGRSYGGGHGRGYGPRGPMSSMSSASTTHMTSSGTSDCMWGPPSCDYSYLMKDMKPIYFQDKIEEIAEETTQGKGPHLEALAQLLGCSYQEHGIFSQLLKKHYRSLFVETQQLSRKEQAFQALSQLEQLIQEHSVLQSQCQNSHNTG